jgi:16S rRNA processing protein RimM
MSQKIIVGRIGKSYGVFGWVKVYSYTEPTEKILTYPHWFIKIKNQFQPLTVETTKMMSGKLTVKFHEIDSPENAKQYANLELFIPKEDLPALDNDEFYWDDLIGCHVINRKSELLGEVKKLLSTGANDVLVVENADKRILIPYLNHVIDKVDIKTKTITVDWDADYT